MIKKEIRVLGIDDAPFDKFKEKSTFIVGTFFRGGSFIDGILSRKIRIDGRNSTKKIIEMIKQSKFKPQLQAILLDGIAFGGFNVVDITKIYKETKIPVIVVMRTYPNFPKIERALKKLNKKDKIKLLRKAGEIHKVNKIHIQVYGMSLQKAKQVIKITTTHAHIPEPIRIAHIIASGIKEGESRGKA